jgi:hypothetical protein
MSGPPELDSSDYACFGTRRSCLLFSDVRGRHVHSEHVRAALDKAASGPVAESILAGEAWPSQPPINHLFQAALTMFRLAIEMVDQCSFHG